MVRELNSSKDKKAVLISEEGIEVVLVNPNVATIQTGKKFVGDKAYFLPTTPEFMEKVIEKERPDGILLGFGGQTALKCGTESGERGMLKINIIESGDEYALT